MTPATNHDTPQTPALHLVRDTDTGSTDGVEPPLSPEEVLAGADAEAFYRGVAGLARTGQSDVLTTMTYSPDIEYHQPTSVCVEPDVQSTSALELYGAAAYPGFEEHLLRRFRDPTRDHLLEAIHHLLVHEGRNIALVTNHGDIMDIALITGALTIAMCEPGRDFGVLGESISLEDYASRSNLVVSKMVATTEALTLPTAEVLSRICRTFYSVPQTVSRRKAKLDPELVRATNDLVRRQLEERMAAGGQMLSMAASGSQDLGLAASLVKKMRTTWRHWRGDDPEEGPSRHLQPLGGGTVRLMRQCHYAVPVAISLEVENPVCVIGGLTPIGSDEDCHRLMEWIAGELERSTGVNTVYHRSEDALLKQVRVLRRLPSRH